MLTLGGCFDFVEPDLPEAGAPAVLQTTISTDETGRFQAGALLVPSLTVEGLNRRIPDDTLRVSGFKLVPSAVRKNDTREYALATTLPDPATRLRPIRVQAPLVTGVVAQPPSVDWFALERADPDTVIARANQDLELHLIVEPGQSQPQPNQRLWNLDLVGEDSLIFRIGAQGLPPATLRIPSYWIPASRNGHLAAYLTYHLTGTYRPTPGDYIHVMNATQRIRWNVRLANP